MLRASIAFFVVAVIAYFLGANQIAGVTMDIGKLLLWVFLVLGAISLIVSLVAGRQPKQIL